MLLSVVSPLRLHLQPDWEIVNTHPLHHEESAVSPENDEAVTSQDSPDGQALPAGWEMRLDDQGRRFYVNQSERIQQWDFPTRYRRIEHGCGCHSSYSYRHVCSYIAIRYLRFVLFWVVSRVLHSGLGQQ